MKQFYPKDTKLDLIDDFMEKEITDPTYKFINNDSIKYKYRVQKTIKDKDKELSGELSPTFTISYQRPDTANLNYISSHFFGKE